MAGGRPGWPYRLRAVTRHVGGPDTAARWRLFVALPVPGPSAAAIHAGLAPYRAAFPEARWIDPAGYHVTLRFLGAMDPRIVESLAAVVRDCGGTGRPFQVAVGRGGGAHGRSEVAWLDLLDGRAQVVALADRLDGLLPVAVRAGLPPSRPAPHLTVARRAPRALAEALRDARLAAIRVPWTADRLALFRSHTGTPAGSRYEALAEARLAA